MAQGRPPHDPWNDDWDQGSWNRKEGDFDEPVVPIRFTEAERALSNQQTMRGLLRTVAIQFFASLAVALLAFVVSGSAAGVSAAVGAMAYIIPNALFAFKLVLSVNKPGGVSPTTFFLGEFLKIAIAALLLVGAASLGREFLVWPAFLAGLVCALKSQWLALAFGKKNF